MFVVGTVNHTHATAADLFGDPVVAEDLADECAVAGSLSGRGKVPLPPSSLACILGPQFSEFNE